MKEKVFKTVAGAGISNLVLGIITILVGLTTGILLLVNGAKLVKCKDHLMI